MQDGVVENFTAGVIEPYLDAEGRPTDNVGKSFVDPEELKLAVTRLDAGLPGPRPRDRGSARTVKHSTRSRPRGRPTGQVISGTTSHIQVIHPDDVPRFAELGVVANAQPLWAINEGQMEHLTVPFLGPERSTWQYPFGSLVRAGATVAMGSDWSVSSPNPVWGIHIAVNRMTPAEYAYGHEADAPFLPIERLDVGTALEEHDQHRVREPPRRGRHRSRSERRTTWSCWTATSCRSPPPSSTPPRSCSRAAARGVYATGDLA